MTEPAQQAQTNGNGSSAPQMARYTFLVPTTHTGTGLEVPHLLDTLRKTLSMAGFHGRNVIKNVESDWEGVNPNTPYETSNHHMVMVDAPADSQTEETMKQIAQGIKRMSGAPGSILHVSPITVHVL